MLFVGKLRVFRTVVDLLESCLGCSKGVKSTLPDDGIARFATRNRSHALPCGENASMLQFGKLLLKRLEFLFVGRVVLLNQTKNDRHDVLLGKTNCYLNF